VRLWDFIRRDAEDWAPKMNDIFNAPSSQPLNMYEWRYLKRKDLFSGSPERLQSAIRDLEALLASIPVDPSLSNFLQNEISAMSELLQQLDRQCEGSSGALPASPGGPSCDAATFAR
jgi:hypothetical protein